MDQRTSIQKFLGGCPILMKLKNCHKVNWKVTIFHDEIWLSLISEKFFRLQNNLQNFIVDGPALL